MNEAFDGRRRVFGLILVLVMTSTPIYNAKRMFNVSMQLVMQLIPTEFAKSNIIPFMAVFNVLCSAHAATSMVTI